MLALSTFARSGNLARGLSEKQASGKRADAQFRGLNAIAPVNASGEAPKAFDAIGGKVAEPHLVQHVYESCRPGCQGRACATAKYVTYFGLSDGRPSSG